MLSSSSARVASLGERRNGSAKRVHRITAAKITKTVCQHVILQQASATGAPITCPADPAAVPMPSAIERFSGAAARPTMARITPKPVPAMPKPTRISSVCMLPGRARHRTTAPAPPHKASRPQDDRLAVAEALGHGAEQRLADAPGQVLDGDGQRELGPRPAEFLGDGNLEHPETGPDGKADHQDDRAGVIRTGVISGARRRILDEHSGLRSGRNLRCGGRRQMPRIVMRTINCRIDAGLRVAALCAVRPPRSAAAGRTGAGFARLRAGRPGRAGGGMRTGGRGR
jgi:hypothetical protein